MHSENIVSAYENSKEKNVLKFKKYLKFVWIPAKSFSYIEKKFKISLKKSKNKSYLIQIICLITPLIGLLKFHNYIMNDVGGDI
jgi:hypothetical protein